MILEVFIPRGLAARFAQVLILLMLGPGRGRLSAESLRFQFGAAGRLRRSDGSCAARTGSFVRERDGDLRGLQVQPAPVATNMRHCSMDMNT